MKEDNIIDKILELIRLYPHCLPSYIDRDCFCDRCKSLLLDPFRLSCDHIICNICLKESCNTQAQNCFICNGKIEGSIINNKVKAKVHNILINCPSRAYNCKWQGKPRDLLDHYESCDYKLIPCDPNCGQIHPRLFMTEHKSSTCPERLLHCDHCSIVIKDKNYDIMSILNVVRCLLNVPINAIYFESIEKIYQPTLNVVLIS